MACEDLTKYFLLGFDQKEECKGAFAETYGALIRQVWLEKNDRALVLGKPSTGY